MWFTHAHVKYSKILVKLFDCGFFVISLNISSIPIVAIMSDMLSSLVDMGFPANRA